jgi:hypothetical protein
MTESALKSVANGTHQSWKTRNLQSYPEIYFQNILEKIGIFKYCELEYPIRFNKYNSYFLDFYFKNKKIDLEIDGSQHKKRVNQDIKRDIFLKSQGIKVFRIEWRNPKTIEGKKYLDKKIKEFYELYNAS